MQRGVTVDGHNTAIDTICSWLDQWRVGHGRHAWWPEVIDQHELRNRKAVHGGPPRPSWCYGTPGIARAQHLAGLATGDHTRVHLAEQALLGCATDERQLAQLTDASLCHGWAGLAHTLVCGAADTDNPRLTRAATTTLTRMREQVNQYARPAHDGLLEGTSGIALADLETLQPARSGWDTCLLVRGASPNPLTPEDTVNTATDASAHALRNAMVDRILTSQTLAGPVEQALRHVERHRYVPGTPLDTAYDADAVITHTFADGTSLSCASHPDIVATMLDMLDVEPGQRILEIGAGTGYNAALLATLTGPTGTVTTIDINSEVTDGARHHLDDTGFSHVTVLTRDGALSAPEHAPYDRIIVTVGACDIPQAWWDQLVPGGRLVLPLRWRGTTRGVAFTKGTDRWEADRMFLCGFVPMLGQNGERSITIDPDGLVTIHHDIDRSIDTDALQDVLTRDKTTVWTEVTVHGEEPFDRVWLRLSAAEDGTVRIQADNQAVESGLCTPAIAVRSPALVDGDSLAYFTIRRDQTPGRWQLGAIGHGPAGAQLADRINDQITKWDRDRTADPTVLVYPNGTKPADSTGKVIKKPHSHLLINY